jgi:hypothetical protein
VIPTLVITQIAKKEHWRLQLQAQRLERNGVLGEVGELSPRFPHGFLLSTKKATRDLCQACDEDFVPSPLRQNLDRQNPVEYTKRENSGSNFQVSKREPDLLLAIPPTNKKRRRSLLITSHVLENFQQVPKFYV